MIERILALIPELRIFVVMFLMFVSVFYASKDNEDSRQRGNGGKRIAEKPECKPAKGGT